MAIVCAGRRRARRRHPMAKKRAGKRGVNKTGRGRSPARGASAQASDLSTAELAAELRRRSRAVHALQRRRSKIAAQLAELDTQIASMGGAIEGSDGRRRRPRNESNLAEALAGVLKGKTMSVTEAAEAVQAAGYVTTAANFRVIVNQTLIRDKRFKKIARGQYTAA